MVGLFAKRCRITADLEGPGDVPTIGSEAVTGVTRRAFLYKSVMTLMALPLLACDDSEPSSPPPVDCSKLFRGEMKVDHLLLLFIDRTGSFLDGAPDRAARIRDESSHLALGLPPATLFVARYVAERSYHDREKILDGAIPGLPQVDCSENPFEVNFDPRCREKKRQSQALAGCVGVVQQRIADKLRSLNPRRAGQSDIWGAMWAGSAIFQVYPRSQRGILIYSDLEDNVGTRIPEPLPGFEGVRVIARGTGNQDLQKIEALRAAFAKRLSRWGATVTFIPPEVPVDPNNIFGIKRS